VELPDTLVAGDIVHFHKAEQGQWIPDETSGVSREPQPKYEADGSVHELVQQLRTRVESRYKDDTHAILRRLETLEQNWQTMAPALHGVLDRVNAEHAEKRTLTTKIDKMLVDINILQYEASTHSELTQAKTAQHEESIARLEALAIAAESKIAETQTVEALIKLVDQQKSMNTKQYTSLEAQLQALSASCTGKLRSLETQVQAINTPLEQPEANFRKDIQNLNANLQEQMTGFSLWLTELSMAMAQRSGERNSIDVADFIMRFEGQAQRLERVKNGEHPLMKLLADQQSNYMEKVERALHKRLDDERVRNQESLKFLTEFLTVVSHKTGK
jgi:chromosome segregation ATPase